MKNGLKFTRRQVIGAGAAAAAGLYVPHAMAADLPRPIVVELFTSQGCSSCPPADALLETLKHRDDIIAVTENVDYWDYLGWRDTFASKEFTRRQYDYARYRGDGQVYTPQMVINGRVHVVGSRRSHVDAVIEREKRRLSDNHVPLKIKETGSEIVVDIDGAGGGQSKKRGVVWVMVTQDQATQQIKRGENAGHSITYHNILRKLIPAGVWRGDSMQLKFPRESLMIEQRRNFIALLQSDGHGEIIGCGKLVPQSV